MHAHIRAGHTRVISRKRITVRRKDGTSYSYIRKSKVVRVSSTPAKDVGAAGKSTKVIGKLKGGMLTKYGYHPVEAMTNRHKALSKGISLGEKPLSVMRRLIDRKSTRLNSSH